MATEPATEPGAVADVGVGSADDPGIVAGQFRFFDAHVVRTHRLGPTLTRITFGGGQLAGFASGGRDQSFSLFLPRPGQPAPLLPDRTGDGWYRRWRLVPPEQQAVLRSYTVRAQRAEPAELDVDFALHGTGPDDPAGAAGPASRWAAQASPGDRVVLLGPAVADNRSVGFRPPPGTDWVLLAADETALPALGGILDWLPAGTKAKAWIEVPHAQDVQDLASAAEVEITWLVRGAEGPSGDGALADAVRAAELPPGVPYAWIAGESGAVKALRRHLVRERGFDRGNIEFSGYWRRGTSEEQLRAEA
ncbi:siderophore-interacting protein [Kitasatospora xanthocidica]|uniref:siderophore-interacting protein n=1 Tax=Kitasatospora xanthocidica TaxID=83382 RepID=UPI001677716F|nr:siderophore-interacting protein [Kitasatospora xanthocidica]GHF38536.1 siderophore-interacting protein [Kitasatospora xanthocidica]